MKRFAFKMYLKPGCENEYAKRHATIWPELKKQLVEHQGISNYSIFWIRRPMCSLLIRSVPKTQILKPQLMPSLGNGGI